MTPAESLSLVQGTPEWLEARVGFVTASRCGDVIAMKKPTKNQNTPPEEMKARADYRMELIVERLTKLPYPQYVSWEMQWGIDHESEARVAYEIQQDVLVDTVGFVQHPTMPLFGASPDGLVGDDGLIQIKCPNTRTHLEWTRGGFAAIPVEHLAQMIAELACTERKWCDFVSFDPRLPEHLQLFVYRYVPDPKFVTAVERDVDLFNREIESELLALPQPRVLAQVLDMPKPDEMEF